MEKTKLSMMVKDLRKEYPKILWNEGCALAGIQT